MKPDRDSIHRRAIRLGAAAFVVGLGLGSVALAHELDDVVVVTQPVHEDLYAAGESVEIQADIDGDLTVAGQRVTVAGRIQGDVMAAGESVALSGALLDDARVAARSITLTGSIGDHIAAAGETVVLAEPSTVGGFAWLAGNRVDVQGDVGGDLVARGQRVTLAGEVLGNATIDAAEAVIEDGAHIRGDLTWPRGHAPEIQAGARIDGRRIETAGSAEPQGMARAPAIAMGIIIGTLSLLLLTLVLRAVVPPVMQGAEAHLRARPGMALGAGLLALLVAPAAAILAFITVIGAPLGVVLLFAYVILLVVGVPVALDLAVDLVLGRARKGRPISWGWRLLALALVSLVFVALLQIPILGAIVGFVTLVMGLGALVLRAMRRSGAGDAGVIAGTTGSTPAVGISG
jgi:cytoskeletal protein CcmA (bactofilin family)